MQFEVKLIKAPEMNDMSSWDVFELMANARHVSGRYWIFEGDIESLTVPVICIATGITSGTGDMSDAYLYEHACDIFGYEIKSEPSWVMLSEKGNR